MVNFTTPKKYLIYDIWDMLNTMQKTAFLYVAQIKKHFFLTDPLPKNVK